MPSLTEVSTLRRNLSSYGSTTNTGEKLPEERRREVRVVLSQEQLTNVFLNVEDLIRVNAKFTEALKDAIEMALDQGDEDLCTVSIGKLFLEASPMLGAFKSYCTRQVS